MATVGFGWSRVVTGGYWVVEGGYGWFRVVTGGNRRLRVATVGFGWL